MLLVPVCLAKALWQQVDLSPQADDFVRMISGQKIRVLNLH